MIGEKRLNRHRRIIFTLITALHVSFLLRRAQAQPVSPLTPGSYGMQTKPDPSKPIVFAVLLCAFFFVGFLSVFLRNCSGSDPSPAGRNRRRAAHWSRRSGLDGAILENFPVFAYSSVKDRKIRSGELECAVCLSEFEANEILRLIPKCNHVFHVDCVDAWLYSHATCPVCRAKLAPESEKLGEGESPVTEPIAAVSSGPDNSEIDGAGDHIAIDIDGNRTGDCEAITATMKRERRPRSGVAGKFPRSNSTGHSLGQLRETMERYTLRLPEDVRKRVMAASGRNLKRPRSYDGVYSMAAAEGSTRRDCRSGGEGSGSRGRGRGYGAGSGEISDRVNRRDRRLLVPKMGAVRSRNDNGELIVRVRVDGPLK